MDNFVSDMIMFFLYVRRMFRMFCIKLGLARQERVDTPRAPTAFFVLATNKSWSMATRITVASIILPSFLLVHVLIQTRCGW